MNRREIFLALLAGTAVAWSVQEATAACDPQILQKLVEKGFSKDEILKLCGAEAAAKADAQHPAELTGVWEGAMRATRIQMTVRPNGTYSLTFNEPNGTSGVQSGTWLVDNGQFAMTPQTPAPGNTEYHGYQFDAAGTTMTMTSARGPIYFTKKAA
jgi:hypothetical protein